MNSGPTTCCLIFNIDVLEPKEDGSPGVRKITRKMQVAVYMSPQEAKSLGDMILKNVKDLEEKMKTKYALPEDKDKKIYT